MLSLHRGLCGFRTVRGARIRRARRKAESSSDSSLSETELEAKEDSDNPKSSCETAWTSDVVSKTGVALQHAVKRLLSESPASRGDLKLKLKDHKFKMLASHPPSEVSCTESFPVSAQVPACSPDAALTQGLERNKNAEKSSASITSPIHKYQGSASFRQQVSCVSSFVQTQSSWFISHTSSDSSIHTQQHTQTWLSRKHIQVKQDMNQNEGDYGSLNGLSEVNNTD